MSIFILYLIIGLFYWAFNSFIRKLDIDGDWLLPIIWFLAWPFGLLYWVFKLLGEIVERIADMVIDKKF